MQFSPSCGLRTVSGALLLIHLGIWNCMAYLDREPRLRQISIWKRLLPWLNPPTAKLEPKQPFFVVWNAPTFRCGRKYGLPMDLKKFGIVGNDLELFHGDVINLFYESRLGLYPRILKNGISFNGGIPQLANFTAHFEWVKADLDWYIPNKTYDGLAVIDWEAWRPLFEQNLGNEKRRYALRALAVVQSRHPWWRGTHVYWKTQQEFDKAARRLMEQTNALCQKLRPNAKWGFYLFPTCFNSRPGQNYCKKSTIDQNDKMAWLYQNSKALYPSVYLKSQQHPELQRLYVEGALRETYRVSRRHCQRDALVIPYTRYSYPKNKQFYSKSDLESSIGQAADSGAAGIVLWESYKNIQHKTDCNNTRNYLHTVLGPFVKDVLKFTQKCRESLCNGHGRCISRQWSNYGLVNSKPHNHNSKHRRGKRSASNNTTEYTGEQTNTPPIEYGIGENISKSFDSRNRNDFAAVNISDDKEFNEKPLENNTLKRLWRDNINSSNEYLEGTLVNISMPNGTWKMNEKNQIQGFGEKRKLESEVVFDPTINSAETQSFATGSFSSTSQFMVPEITPLKTMVNSELLESSMNYREENTDFGTPKLDVPVATAVSGQHAMSKKVAYAEVSSQQLLSTGGSDSLFRKKIDGDIASTPSLLDLRTDTLTSENTSWDLTWTPISTPNLEYSTVLASSVIAISKTHTVYQSGGALNTERNLMSNSATISTKPDYGLTYEHVKVETTPSDGINLPGEDINVSRTTTAMKPLKTTVTPGLLQKRAIRKRIKRRRRKHRGKSRKRRPMENETLKRKPLKRKKVNIRQQFSNYVCRCYDGWTGEFCQQKIYAWN